MSHRKLIIDAFKRAEKEEELKGNKKPSKSARALELSVALFEQSGVQIGEKSLRNYYNEALKNTGEDIKIAQVEVVKGLLKYLGFNDYQEFVSLKAGKVKTDAESLEREGIDEEKQAGQTLNITRNTIVLLIPLLMLFCVLATFFIPCCILFRKTRLGWCGKFTIMNNHTFELNYVQNGVVDLEV